MAGKGLYANIAAKKARIKAEKATDEIRARFGKGSILKGRSLR